MRFHINTCFKYKITLIHKYYSKYVELPSDHFAFNILEKMLAVKIEERLNLKEIILLLTSLKKINKIKK